MVIVVDRKGKKAVVTQATPEVQTREKKGLAASTGVEAATGMA